jgi:hypothetical protein
MTIVSKSRIIGYTAVRKARGLGAIGFALALGACSSTLSQLPSEVGGLPAGTPERTAAPAAFPAVHDMPPPRTDVVLTKDEQKKAEEELAAARANQAKKITAADKDR